MLDVYSNVLGSDAPATKLLIVVNVLCFFLAALDGWAAYGMMPELFGMPRGLAFRWGTLYTAPGYFDAWRYLSANFVHFGLLHLGINMLVLSSFGRAMEERIGGARLIVLFLVTGVFGFLTSELWSVVTGEPGFTGGASAGIAGIIGALIGYTFGQGNPMYKRLLTMVLLYGILFAVLMEVSGVRINHAAHLGGLIVGAGAGWLFFVERRRTGRATARREAAFRRAAAAGLLLSAASIVVTRLGFG